MKTSALMILALSTLALTGCISKDQADKKLAEACTAGVTSQLAEGHSVEKTEMTGFADITELNSTARKVDLKLAINDGFISESKDFSCTFFLVFGPFNMSMNASIYQLKMDDGTVIGQDGLRAQGTNEQIDKLNAAVSSVLDK